MNITNQSGMLEAFTLERDVPIKLAKRNTLVTFKYLFKRWVIKNLFLLLREIQKNIK